MSKQKKKKSNTLATVILIVCGGVLGVLIGMQVKNETSEKSGLFAFLHLLLLAISFYLQIILHEGGHLIAGRMTGYRFSSFRIGSLMLLKTHEGYSFRKFSIAGTGGQCLLIPPNKKPDGTYPYKLYHLGGVLLNLITAGLFFAIYCFGSMGNVVRSFFLYLAVSGAAYAVMNGIPMRVSGVATDGYNVLHIGKEPFALDAMWLQLKINEAQTEGIRLKDLPEKWFILPENASKNNEIISAIAVFSENRAMDALDFGKAKEIISMLEDSENYSVIGIYRNLLLLDKITIDLMENGVDADISALNDPQVKVLRRSMAKYPAVIRTEYAVRLLKEKDPTAAKKYTDLLDAVGKTYPMKSDIESETEIMNHLASCIK